jgi:hemolysin activation/secretion protein
MHTHATAIVAFGLLAVACLPAQAQTPPNASRALEIISTPPDLAEKPQPSLPQPGSPPVREERTAEAEYQFQVIDFKLTGAKRFPEAELKALLSEFTGRKISLRELNAGTDRISKHYREHNLPFVQIFIPPQDVTEGIVEIRIVEGRVGKIETRVAEGSRIKPEVAAMLAESMPVGGPIDYTLLTRSILLLNDLPGIQAKVDLGPGASIGDVGLQLTLSDRGPLANYSLDADNHGNLALGESRIGGTLRLNNLSGIGDQLVARLQHSSGNGVNSAQLSYQRPVGLQGTKLGGQVSKFIYESGQATGGAEGNGLTWNLNASYPVLRSRGKNRNLTGALEYRDLEDGDDPKYISQLSVGMDGDSTDTWRGGGITSYSIGVSIGEVKNDAPFVVVDGGYTKLSLDLQRRQFLSDKHTLLAKMRGQLPSTNLDNTEKMSLGGPNGVRGYPVGYASSDTAMISSVEWQYAVGNIGQGFSLVPSLFVDYSFARQQKSHQPDNIRNLWSLGVGLLAYRPGQAQFSAMLARRGSYENPAQDDDDDRYQFWLQAVISF